MAYWHQSVLSITEVHKTILKHAALKIRPRYSDQSRGVSKYHFQHFLCLGKPELEDDVEMCS